MITLFLAVKLLNLDFFYFSFLTFISVSLKVYMAILIFFLKWKHPLFAAQYFIEVHFQYSLKVLQQQSKTKVQSHYVLKMFNDGSASNDRPSRAEFSNIVQRQTSRPRNHPSSCLRISAHRINRKKYTAYDHHYTLNRIDQRGIRRR